MSSNVFLQLRAREREKRRFRRNHRIMRKLVCQEDVQYVKVWEKQSASSIEYENDRIFFNNYRTCYAGYGHKGKPSILYELPKCPTKQKIEDVLICQYPCENVSNENRSHLIVLTKDNWLVRHDINTGTVLQRVFLHSVQNFHYLDWNDEGSTFTVRTTQNKVTPAMRDANVQANILLMIAAFSIYPLELRGCMEIDKRVFGRDVLGASLVGCDLLFTTHCYGMVKFYSFERIINENTIHPVKLGDDFPSGDADRCKIGEAPLGIPVTIKLTEKPPVLLQICCHDNNIRFGGFPWHFIAAPYGRQDPHLIKVYDLATQKEAVNGSLEKNMLAIESLGAMFHFDGTERIVHIKKKSLRVLKLHQLDDGRCELREDHCIEPHPQDDSTQEEREAHEYRPRRSMSGRILKMMYDMEESGYYQYMTSEMICHVGCENDLDLTLVVIPKVDMDTDISTGYVTLHDQGTGRLLKTITMPGEWDDTVEHHVTMDLDTLVHVFKDTSGKSICQVFRMFRKKAYEESKKEAKKHQRHHQQHHRQQQHRRRRNRRR